MLSPKLRQNFSNMITYRFSIIYYYDYSGFTSVLFYSTELAIELLKISQI